jgi:crossover junction endodeoxyribonuclease RuvC
MGIDPGQSGGIALIRGTGKVLILETMPSTERDIWLLLKSLEELPHKVYIEKVHAMPQQGVSSTFKFGVGYGGLRMALTAAGIPFDEVTPQLWQKALGVVKRAKTESKNDHKKKLLQKKLLRLLLLHQLKKLRLLKKLRQLKSQWLKPLQLKKLHLRQLTLSNTLCWYSQHLVNLS